MVLVIVDAVEINYHTLFLLSRRLCTDWILLSHLSPGRRDQSMMGTKLCSLWSSRRGPGGRRGRGRRHDGGARQRQVTMAPQEWRGEPQGKILWLPVRLLVGCPCRAKAVVFPDLQLQPATDHVPNLLLPATTPGAFSFTTTTPTPTPRVARSVSSTPTKTATTTHR
jgi:hypothetical protein